MFRKTLDVQMTLDDWMLAANAQTKKAEEQTRMDAPRPCMVDE